MKPDRGRGAPDLDAKDFRDLLGQAADIAARHWERVPDMPAYTRPPEAVVAAFRAQPLPERGAPVREIFDRIERDVVAYPLGVGQRRWWGFINSPPHPVGIAADLIATTLKNNCAGTSQMAIQVELTVMDWLAQLVGLPRGANGLLVSGGSMANLVALAGCREAKLPGTRRRGLRAAAHQPTIYASTEAHSCVRRAVELLGLGTDALRLVPVDREYRMDVATLRQMIAADRAGGLEPICVVASAGTVNTGVVDPLAERRCRAGARVLVPRGRGLWRCRCRAPRARAVVPRHRAGRFGRARSPQVAVCPVRGRRDPGPRPGDPARHVRAPCRIPGARAGLLSRRSGLGFGSGPPAHAGVSGAQGVGGDAGGGRRALPRAVRSDIAVAREIERLAREHARLEVLAPSDLSCFCLRYVPGRGDANAFNRTLLDRTHRDGRMFISGTTLDGRFALRGCVTNFRSTLADAQVCIDTIVELGEQLEQEQG